MQFYVQYNSNIFTFLSSSTWFNQNCLFLLEPLLAPDAHFMFHAINLFPGIAGESIVTGVNRSSFPTANIDTWRSPNCPYVNPIKESNFVRLSHAYRILSALNIPEKHNGVFKTHTTGDKYDGFEKRVCYVEGTHYMITVVPSVSKEKRPQDKVKVIANRMTSSELKPR